MFQLEHFFLHLSLLPLSFPPQQRVTATQQNAEQVHRRPSGLPPQDQNQKERGE